MLAGLLLGAVQAAQPDPALLDGEWSVETSDGAGMRLNWRNAREGKPAGDQVRSIALAVPPGQVADAAFEAAQPAGGTVVVSPPSRFRDVMVSALSLQPGTASSAKLRITFRKAVSGPAFRPAFAPGEETPPERHLKGWLANYPQSRSLRSTLVPALSKSGAEGPTAGAFLPKHRLVIRTLDEKIQVLPYDSLIKAGVPLSKINPRHMHLYSDGREIPIHIMGEGDGRWDPGDYIEFIGKRASGQNTYNSLYTTRSVFILVWDDGKLGLRAPAVPVASRTGGLIPTFPADAKAALPFRVRKHLEEDIEILRIGSTSAEEILDLGSNVQASELTDFWVWKRLGAEKDQAELAFSLHHSPSATAKGGINDGGGGAGSFRLTVNLKGITNNPNADPDHHLKFLLNDNDISGIGGVVNDAIWEGQESHTWVSQALDPSILEQGENILVIQKVNDLKTTDGQLVEIQDAYINYMVLEFPSTYAVYKNELGFSNAFPDSTGLKLFTLTGFTTDKVSLWDKQGRKLTNFRMVRRGESFELSFLDTLMGHTEYLASADSRRKVPLIQLDTLDDLMGTAQGADYLVITQKELLGKALDSLLEFREKQGLRTRVVMARHIYQAFGDGSLDPAAIRRFVAYAYKNWARPAPSYLVLVGDASQGFEKHGETIVPFHPVNIVGWGVAANDDFFAKVSGDDDLADLFVGRIPAGNKQDLSNVVRKTLNLETARPQGHWRNKTLLIAGFESSFTAQNYVLQGIATANDRNFSRLDLYPGSPHYKTSAQRANFYDQLDSGFNLVSFVGHGGGAVWSDAGVLTLKALDEGKLKGEYPISLVSSITCLTGFYEDNSARSLGEEMVRMPKGGAAGFYGAAGYISGVAGDALSAEILNAATGNAYATTGAIVTQAENMVKLRTGAAFLPILAEFNLLGDPALRMSFPANEGTLSLDPLVLAGAADLVANGSGLALDKGEAVATVLLGDSVASIAALKVSGGALTLKHTFPIIPGGIQNGKVLINYFDDAKARVVSAPFSTLDWLIDSVAIEPAIAAPGDSVRIRMKLNTAYAKTSYTGGVASFVVGGEVAPMFPGDNQNGLQTTDGIHLETVSKVLLEVPTTDLAGPRVYLAFRLNIQILNDQGEPERTIPNLSSRIYSLPLSELPRLELPANAMHLPIQEKAGLWVVIHNRGFGTAEGFKVSLTRDTESSEPVTDTLSYPGRLGLGGLDSLFFSLADSILQGKRIRASIIPTKDGDLAATGRSQDTVFHVATKLLSSLTDTLKLDTAGSYLTLPASDSKPLRVFVEKVSISTLPPHLAPGEGSLPITAYRILASEFTQGRLVLGKTQILALPKVSAAAVPCWHYRDLEGLAWVKLDTVASGAGNRSGTGFQSGLYALLLNQDATSPFIQLSSRGQALLQDDYVPLNTPIDVVIRDGEGVDLALHPPTLVSRKQSLDSANYAQETANLFPTLARINFLPNHKSDQDSITVTARDISGNTATKTLLYRMGDDLSIRDLGSYPNPFADTATFVYSLTDYCDKVELKIYSRSGRLVRTLEEKNVVGYQEVVWDGRTGSGKNIANGLYFLKVTAKAGKKETSKVYKLFKKQRK